MLWGEGTAQATANAAAAERTPRLSYGDGMRLCGSLAVILIHVCGFERRPALEVNPVGWWVCNGFSAASQWAVPLFVMLSGALLLDTDRNESLGRYSLRRFLRVGIPLLFWSIFYVRWSHPEGVPPATWDAIRHGKPYYHLYFLFILIGLYLITPLLRPLMKLLAGPAREWLTLGGLAATMLWFTSHPSRPEPLAGQLFLPYIGYYTVGFALRRRVGDPLTPALSLVAALIAFGFVLFGEWGRATGTFTSPWLRLLYQGHFSPVIVLFSLAVFVYLREVWTREFRWVFWFAWLSPGIYLVHPYFLELVAKIGLTSHTGGALIGVPLTTLVVLALSAGLTFGLLKIPVVRALIGG